MAELIKAERVLIVLGGTHGVEGLAAQPVFDAYRDLLRDRHDLRVVVEP